eukprot:198582_1
MQIIQKHGYATLCCLSLVPIGTGALLLLAKKAMHEQVTDLLLGKEYTKITDGYSNVPKLLLTSHIVCGAAFLLAYMHQFNSKKRNKNISFHRQMGYVAISTAALTAFGGVLWSAKYSKAGLPQLLPVIMSAAGWTYCAMNAYINIKQKNVDGHAKWMIRSFAFGGFAIPLRAIWMPLAKLFGMKYDNLWPTTMWSGMFINFMIGEYVFNSMVKSKKKKKKRKTTLIKTRH